MKTGILERPRLLEVFLSGTHRRMTLVEAPAGYGKTTLLKSWLRHLDAAGAATTWISIDPALHDFDAALKPALARRTRETSPPDSAPAARRGFLFLDDFHEAGSFEMQTISRILHRGDDDFHIVIGTRMPPAFPLAKLRLSDQVTDLGMDQLKFNLAEASVLLQEVLPPETIKSYYDYAEGWPAALQLMRLSSAQGHLVDLAGDRPLRSGLDLAGYLNEQFLIGLTAEQNQFLLETAHLNPVNGDLADHMRGSSDSWEILGSLNDAHSLVFEQTDGDSSWYRYHQLLQDYLLHRQQTLGEVRRNSLYLRAAEWLNEHGRHYSAAKLAMSTGAPDVAEQIILDAGGTEIGICHGAQRLAPLIELLPLERINASPRLSLARAYLLLKSGRTGEANLVIQDARDGALPSDRELEREIVLLEVHLRLYEDRNISEAQVAALNYTAQQTPVKDQLKRGVLHNFLCLFYIQLGELEKAREAGETAMALYADLGWQHLVFFMHLNLSVVNLDLGEFAIAHERRRRAREMQREFFCHDPNLSAIATIMFSETAFEADDSRNLESSLTAALNDADNREGWSEVFLAGYETCLAMKLETGGYEEALGLVSQAEAMIVRRSLPRFSRQLKILELDLAVSAGREQEARRLAGSVRTLIQEGRGADGLRWRGQVLSRLSLARFESRFGDPQKALKTARQIEKECRDEGLHRYRLRALVLSMISAVSADDTKSAAETLAQALKLGRQHGMKGAFLRESDRFAEAAKTVVRERGVSGYVRDDLSFLSNLLSKVKDHPDPGHILSEVLTDKEFEVLSSLTEGNANKVIARALNLSEPTVKFHLQNIYRKLGVNSRKLAAELAMQHGVRPIIDKMANS
ncbi:MAG: LuxR C-terminal-related transcriptional regulator [Stappiaceae bacterium]